MTSELYPARSMALSPYDLNIYHWFHEDRWALTLEPFIAECYPKYLDAWPISNVREALRVMAEREWPGCEIWLDRTILADFLYRQAPQYPPLFMLPCGCRLAAFCLRRLREIMSEGEWNESHPSVRLLRELHWLITLGWSADPEDAALIQPLFPLPFDPVKDKDRIPAGGDPLWLECCSWSVFRLTMARGRQRRLVSFKWKEKLRDPDWTGIYSRRDAERLARRLFTRAMPFQSRGTRVLVFGCADPRSVPMLAAAYELLPPPKPLWQIRTREDRGGKGSHRKAIADVQQALEEALLGPRAARLNSKLRLACCLHEAGLEEEQIAQAWLYHKLSRSEEELEEDILENTLKQVRRTLDKIYGKGRRRKEPLASLR